MEQRVGIGNYLQHLRKQQKRSRKELVARSGISLRTLHYWEANEVSPRRDELERVLDALSLSQTERREALSRLTSPRGRRMAREIEAVDAAEIGPSPDLGDLMRVMRERRGWKQAGFARVMGVSRFTLHRWEQNRNLPSAETLERFCQLLEAHPEEKAALLQLRFARPAVPDTPWELCQERLASLYSQPEKSAIPEFQFLFLRRQLCLHLPHRPEARQELLHLDRCYKSWLHARNA